MNNLNLQKPDNNNKKFNKYKVKYAQRAKHAIVRSAILLI